MLMLSFARVFERDGAKVVVDATSLEYMKGATVDFEVDLMRSAFCVVNNPQSESACGCKSSFAMKNFSAHPALD
jgi:iron-sulfur cluster assembly accessory protein